MTNAFALPAVLILVVLAAVGVIVLVALLIAARRTRSGAGLDGAEQQGKYPEGYWMGVGMGIGLALGMAVGVAIGIATDNPALGFALGPGMGVALGVAIGSGLEQRHKDEIRPLTAEEQRTRRILAWVGVATLAIGVVLLAAILLTRTLA